MLPLAGPTRVTDTFLKFTFQMDSVVVNLSTAPDVGLASFGIYHLSLKGYQLVDKSLFASIVLCDMQLDDCRPGRENMITKFLNKKNRSALAAADGMGDAEADQPETTMLDIILRVTNQEMFVHMLVSSFDLILSLEFLMQLLNFISLPTVDVAAPPSDVAVENVPVRAAAVPANRSQGTTSDAIKTTGQKITVNIKIEQPDIILVEQMDNIDCLALMLNVSAGSCSGDHCSSYNNLYIFVGLALPTHRPRSSFAFASTTSARSSAAKSPT